MKNLSLYFLLFLFVTSCASVDRYNQKINKKIAPAKLQADVDYLYKKSRKLHPGLYWYTDKQTMDYRFDSLKHSLTDSLTPNDFYRKISPVLATSFRQGHDRVYPLTPKYKKDKRGSINKNGVTPLYKLEFEVFNERLYITKNYSSDSTIAKGTELVELNGKDPMELIRKYRPTNGSDGYNTTFISWLDGKRFPQYFYYENGLTDSVTVKLQFKDSVYTKMLYRVPPKNSKDSTHKDVKPVKPSKEEIQRLIAEKKKKRLLGYNDISKTYNHELTFPTNDSSAIAVMRIADFTTGKYKTFYKNSFKILDSLKTKSLVIDLRDNTGGKLTDIRNLYTYLADTNFVFLQKAEVTSRTSLWNIGYYQDTNLYQKCVRSIFFPFVMAFDAVSFLKTHKDGDGKYYFSSRNTKKVKPFPNHFKGKVYVLINGGSFSASAIISSNLKGSGRATFVGTETGGAYNGCVAGFMPVHYLPASRLRLRLGLMLLKPNFTTNTDGRGIMPDEVVIPSLNDRITGRDPEIQWIIKRETGK